MSPRHCYCGEQGWSLWSLLPRDRFCPWCGGQVRRLTSDAFLDDPELPRPQLLLYRHPAKYDANFDLTSDLRLVAFTFPVSLTHTTPHRHEEPEIIRSGLATVARPKGLLLLTNGANWFQEELTLPSNDEQSHFQIRFASLEFEDTADWPVGGLHGEVHLDGDFPSEKWSVRLFKAPALECRLRGEGVRHQGEAMPNATLGNSEWEITAKGLLRLKLEVTVHFASIRLKQEPQLKIVRRDGKKQLQDEPDMTWDPQLNQGDELEVNRTYEIELDLDSQDLQVNDVVELTVSFFYCGAPAMKLEHTLTCHRVDAGLIQVSPREILIHELFLGERRNNSQNDSRYNPEGSASGELLRQYQIQPIIPKVVVTNLGESPVTLNCRDATTGGPLKWLTVTFEHPKKHQRSLDANSRQATQVETLKPREFVNLLLDINFEEHDEIQKDLTAAILITDENGTEYADAKVKIGQLRPPTPIESPLFLDFGNSNSFAALLYQRDGTKYEPQPAHDLEFPEEFPTAIFFRTLKIVEPLESECTIGPYAVQADLSTRGANQVSRLVERLKYYLSREGTTPSRIHVRDIRGSSKWIPPQTLLTLYLQEIIRRAELILQGRYVTKLVISYPVKFSPQQRRAFFVAFQAACEHLSKCRDNRPGKLKLEPLKLQEKIRIDEASAVAFGFVYDSAMTKKIVEKLGPKERTLGVAAVDLGGGSLDIALFQFENDSPIRSVPRFKSNRKWIGGDVQFGGNNLRLACFEIIRKRLEAILSVQEWETFSMSQLPEPVDYFAGLAVERAAQFDALWDIAELVKLHACRGNPLTGHSIDPGTKRNLITPDDRAQLRTLLREVFRHQAAPERLDEIVTRHDLWPSETELVEHQVERDQYDRGGYTFRTRLDTELSRLKNVLDNLGMKLHYVVVGGSASRLPSMQEWLQNKLDQAGHHVEIIWEPDHMKSRVAMGLARAWRALGNRGGAQSIDCIGYTSLALGLVEPNLGMALSWLPICHPIRNPNDPRIDQWELMKLPEEPGCSSAEVVTTLRRVLSLDTLEWELEVCRVHEEGNTEPLGKFVSRKSVSPVTNAAAPHSDEWGEVKYCFGDDEDDIQLGIWSKNDPQLLLWSTNLQRVVPL